MIKHIVTSALAGLFLIGGSAPETAAPEATAPAEMLVSPEETNTQAVKQIYAFFESGDVPGFLATLDPAIVWSEAENFPYAVTNPHVGPDAVVAGVFGPMAADWSTFQVVPESYIAQGDKVAMFGRYHAVSTATGKTMDPQVVHVWTFRDGKAVTFQQYADTLATKEALMP